MPYIIGEKPEQCNQQGRQTLRYAPRLAPVIASVGLGNPTIMDLLQLLVTAAVGLIASAVTAVITHLLTRSQERRKYERAVADKVAQFKSTERSETQIMAVQYGHSCFIVEGPDRSERERVFLPIGSRITLGRGKENHIVVEDPGVSRIHAAFRAQGASAYIEPLSPTNGLQVNGHAVTQPQKLAVGDVVTVPGVPFKVTFVPLLA